MPETIGTEASLISPLKASLTSFPRRRESRVFNCFWTPAPGWRPAGTGFRGVTGSGIYCEPVIKGAGMEFELGKSYDTLQIGEKASFTKTIAERKI
jgi:hypothetical protein